MSGQIQRFIDILGDNNLTIYCNTFNDERCVVIESNEHKYVAFVFPDSDKDSNSLEYFIDAYLHPAAETLRNK